MVEVAAVFQGLESQVLHTKVTLVDTKDDSLWLWWIKRNISSYFIRPVLLCGFKWCPGSLCQSLFLPTTLQATCYTSNIFWQPARVSFCCLHLKILLNIPQCSTIEEKSLLYLFFISECWFITFLALIRISYYLFLYLIFMSFQRDGKAEELEGRGSVFLCITVSTALSTVLEI